VSKLAIDLNSLTLAPLMILSGVFAVTVIGIVLGPMILALGHTRAASAITTGSLIISIVTAALLGGC